MSVVAEISEDIATMSEAERAARIELAAFYRLVEHLGWGEGIYNHVAMRVPDDPDKFLIKRHAMTYEEVTASNLVKVDCRDDLDERAGVNKVGFTTHAPIMRARRDVNCTIHIHTAAIIAITAHPKGLRMLSMHALPLYNNVAYQEYTGFAEHVDEQQRFIDDLGDKAVLLMRNHGAVITGSSADNTFSNLLALQMSCEVQFRLEASGQGAVEIDPEICGPAAAQLRAHAKGRGTADWPAWIRRMDRLDPSYRN